MSDVLEVDETRVYLSSEEIGNLVNDRNVDLFFMPGKGWRIKKRIPVKTHLYRHFDSEDNLLYVGISLSTLNRLAAHRKSSHWFDSIAKITIEAFPSRDAALQAEAKAIYKEKPRHNIAGNSG